MIEYLYNAIKASGGDDIRIAAELTDSNGNAIKGGCRLQLYDNNVLIDTVDGTYNKDSNEWTFIIPSVVTEGLTGRYFYSISHDTSHLQFKQPLYLS